MSFKVGDRVRLVTNGGYCSEVKIGQLGTIIHHFGKNFTNGQNCWVVRFDQPHFFSELNFYDAELELASVQPACPVIQPLRHSAFAVGDKVRTKESRYIGTIQAINYDWARIETQDGICDSRLDNLEHVGAAPFDEVAKQAFEGMPHRAALPANIGINPAALKIVLRNLRGG